MKCPHCQQEQPGDYTGSRCHYCCRDLTSKVGGKQNRGTWLSVFFLSFFATPVISLLSLENGPNPTPPLFWIGAIFSGFALAKVFTTRLPALIAATIVFSVGAVAVYFGIVYYGCMLLLNGQRIG